MSAGRLFWGVPDIEATVPRRRLLDTLGSSDSAAVLFVAPSGYGKTVAAAQHVRALGQPTLWLTMSGEGTRDSAILRSIAELLDASAAAPPDSNVLPRQDDLLQRCRAAIAAEDTRGFTLVLDDCESLPARPLVGAVRSLMRRLAPLVSRVVVTTRALVEEDFESLDAATIIDKKDLLFDVVEARAMVESLTVTEVADSSVVQMLDSARGHAALLSMAIAAKEGRERWDETDPSLSALVALERILQAHVAASDRQIVHTVALLKSCTSRELESLFGRGAEMTVRALSRSLPLVRTQSSGGSTSFIVHDLVRDCLIHQMESGTAVVNPQMIATVLSVLADRGDWGRASDVITRLGGEAEAIEFVSEHGDAMLLAVAHEELLRMMEAAGLQQIMQQPRVLYLWSRALDETGMIDESMAKAGAAITLAGHAGDTETLGLAAAHKAVMLIDQGRTMEAIRCAEERMSREWPQMSPYVQCALLLSYASALGMAERRAEAHAALDECQRVASMDPVKCAEPSRRLRRFRVLLDPLWTGRWSTAARRLSPLLDQQGNAYVARQTLRGNLALALTEMGRLGRAGSLLGSVADQGHAFLDAAYVPALGMIAAGHGDYEDAAHQFSRAERTALECNDEVDLHASRVFHAVVKRAAGHLDEALELSERAFEGLSQHDYFRVSRLAVVEIGGCLLALGDAAAARNWIGPESELQETENEYYIVSGSAVLSVADYRDGDLDSAIARLKPSEDYILSESANWRLAMYCRAFPELLGLLAVTLGAEKVPVHLLRMILPENVERSLSECRRLLPEDAWRRLGERSLGEEAFGEYLERKGRPICRVRLFGGLDVSVGSRLVTERDWKKRKARLLFAMLVVKRGQDVSRDVILEHLWPDLTEDKAKNNFYVAWSTMKSALKGADDEADGSRYIESARGRCRILKESVQSDIDEFEALLNAAREAEAEGRLDEAVAALQQLTSIYRGDLLPGDLYDDWFAAMRDAYRIDFIDAMLRGTEILLEKDDPHEALVFARRGLLADPYREDLYQAALRCHILAGQRSAAIETFIQCKTQLAEELGLDPGAETLALYQQIISMEEKPRYDSYGLSD